GRPTRESLFLPVVSSLDFTLSGRPPQAHTSMAEQVGQLDFSPTRLIFQVAEGHPCLEVHRGRLKAGDHILFELDRRIWISQSEFLHGRLCVIAIQHDKSRAELVRVSVSNG